MWKVWVALSPLLPPRGLMRGQIRRRCPAAPQELYAELPRWCGVVRTSFNALVLKLDALSSSAP